MTKRIILFLVAINMCAENYPVEGIAWTTSDNLNRATVIQADKVKYSLTIYNMEGISYINLKPVSGVSASTIILDSKTDTYSVVLCGNYDIKDQIGRYNEHISHLTVNPIDNKKIDNITKAVSNSYSADDIKAYQQQKTALRNDLNASLVGGNQFLIGNMLDNSVTHPNNFINIGEQFFYGSTSLITCNLNAVKQIGNQAFDASQKIEVISSSTLKTAGARFAYNCAKLTKIDLPELTTVGESFAQGCTSLTKISLPSLKSTSGSFAQGCSALIKVLAPTLETLGSNSFSNCKSLRTLSLPELTSTGEGFASNCTKLTKLSLPKLTAAGEFFASNCEYLEFMDIRSLTNVRGLQSRMELTIIGHENAAKMLPFLFPNSMIYIITKDTTLVGTTKGRVRYITAQEADKLSTEQMNASL